MKKEIRQFTINGNTVETEVEVYTFTYNNKHSCKECSRWEKQDMLCPSGYFEDKDEIPNLTSLGVPTK